MHMLVSVCCRSRTHDHCMVFGANCCKLVWFPHRSWPAVMPSSTGEPLHPPYTFYTAGGCQQAGLVQQQWTETCEVGIAQRCAMMYGPWHPLGKMLLATTPVYQYVHGLGLLCTRLLRRLAHLQAEPASSAAKMLPATGALHPRSYPPHHDPCGGVARLAC